MLAQFCQQGKGFVIVILPDVLAVDNASEQNLVVWEALFCNQLCRLLAFEEVQTDAVYVQLADGISEESYATIKENSNELPGMEVNVESHRVYNDAIFYTALCCQNASIQLCKQSLVFFGHIHHQARFIELYPSSAEGLELLEQVCISLYNICNEIRSCFLAVVNSQFQEPMTTGLVSTPAAFAS